MQCILVKEPFFLLYKPSLHIWNKFKKKIKKQNNVVFGVNRRREPEWATAALVSGVQIRVCVHVHTTKHVLSLFRVGSPSFKNCVACAERELAVHLSQPTDVKHTQKQKKT